MQVESLQKKDDFLIQQGIAPGNILYTGDTTFDTKKGPEAFAFFLEPCDCKLLNG